ncbi:MAG: apolipoprotein N-acyltransferase [Bacteroidales bacterium]|jgi:apolipoprotein N-acyltransferase
MNTVQKNLVLSVLSGILLSIPFLLPHTGPIMLFAFVPLLWMEHLFTQRAEKGCWKYYALTFFIWNALTISWISFITVVGGILAVLANAFLSFAIFAIFRRVKKWILQKGKPEIIAHLFLVALWIAWEGFYYNAEITFPWLTLGNGFATNVRLIQWYEITGVLGGSLWIWLVNLFLYYSWKGTLSKWKRITFPVLLLLPVVASLVRFYTYKETSQPVEVLVVQPNIDPVHEKFSTMSQEEQDDRILGLALSRITDNTRLVVAPETSINEVIVGNYFAVPSMHSYKSFISDNPHAAIVFGATMYEFYPPSVHKPTVASRSYRGGWYEIYNSAILLDTTERVQYYHKSKLVTGGEKMPYIEHFPFIEKWAPKLGGTSGTLGIQGERTVFTYDNESIKVGVAICFESVFGEFFTEYVKNGANLMAVITNDGWWRNTPGYRQHVSFASLRAIETRRGIAHCANTGISAIINHKGERVEQAGWWVQDVLSGDINLNHKLTPYVRNGDWIGRGAGWILLLLSLYSLICAFPLRKRG